MPQRHQWVGSVWAATLSFSFFFVLNTSIVQAYEPESKTGPASRVVPGTQATVDRIMTQAVRNIARRYNLNEEQTQYTEELMRRDVTRFLKTHEKAIWPVIRDLLAAQLNGKPPDNPEDVKRIGNAAKPILDEAIKAILEANEEWRMYLTEEQKVMHDHDLAEMAKTFKTMEKNFESWAQGKPTDAPIFPATADRGSPPRPPKPRAGLPKPESDDVTNPGVFEAIVETFLKEHSDLDEGQVDSARSILTEYQGKGRTFQNSKKDELAELDLQQREAMTKRDRKKVAEAVGKRKTLLQPFHLLVEEMQMRLDVLLTTAQRERYAQRKSQATSVASSTDGQGKRTSASRTGKPEKRSASKDKPAASANRDTKHPSEGKSKDKLD